MGLPSDEAVKHEDFFKLLDAEMLKVDAAVLRTLRKASSPSVLLQVQEFTKTQVNQVRQSLQATDAALAGGSGALPIGLQQQVCGVGQVWFAFASIRDNGHVNAQVDEIGERFLQLEKYVNLNFTAFRKILKKHDKNLPNPCSSLYLGRLHDQAWVKGDYSDIIVNISRIYSTLRGDQVKEDTSGAAQVCCSLPCARITLPDLAAVVSEGFHAVHDQVLGEAGARVESEIYDQQGASSLPAGYHGR